MARSHGLNTFALTACAATLLALAGGCAASTIATAPSTVTASAPETASPVALDDDRPASQLRVFNTGSADIKALVVLFPGAADAGQSTRIEFGDVAAGQATSYREAPSGVYGYAAYEYEVDGHAVLQRVIDWVGESPMAGRRFTYRLESDAGEAQDNRIRLVGVSVDEQ